MTDQRDRGNAQRVGGTHHVLGITKVAVVPVWRPVAVTMAAKVQRPDTIAVDEVTRHEIEPVRVGRAAMQAQHARARRGISSALGTLRAAVVFETVQLETGHLDGAPMLDFYRDDFADQLAELDRNTPYLLYCRSGNRSGQTRALMEQLGFSDVAEIEGGIEAWYGAGLPVVGGS